MADIPGGTGTRATLPLDPNFTFGLVEREGDSDWYRVQLKAGTDYAFDADVAAPFIGDGYGLVRVTLRDASGRELAMDTGDSEYEAGFSFRATRSGTYYVELEGEQGGYKVRADVDEGGDLRTKATLAVGEERDALLFYRNDVDVFRVDLERGQSYDFALGDGDADADLELLGRDGRVLATGSGSRGETIAGFEAADQGPYFLRVTSENEEFRSEYTLSARETPGPQPRVVRLTQGDDLFETSETGGPRTVLALGGDDVVSANAAGDVLRGGDGDDDLGSGRADVALFGDAGDDTLSLFGGGTADGGAGRDLITLALNGAELRGGSGADTFQFVAFFPPGVPLDQLDTIRDFGGDDRIDVSDIDADEGSPGVQPLAFVGRAAFSGEGQVRYRYDGGDTLVLVDTDGDRDADTGVRLEGRQTLTAADFVLGERTTEGDDRFEGTPGNDVVFGGGGDDVLRGAGGNDRLDGGEGRDTLEGGTGDDVLSGGPGASDSLDGGPGRDTLTLGGTDGSAFGGDGDDVLNGSDDRDSLAGGAGDDEVSGNEGDDFVSGNEGDDRLYGDSPFGFGEGRDFLVGGEGDDLLDGGLGSDRLQGGEGADRFVFGADTAFDFEFNGARDQIFDFGAGDVIDLSALDANRGAAGNQAFTFVGSRDFSGAGQLRVERDDGTLVLQASTDLDRTAEFEVDVNALALTARDIVL